MSSCVQYRLAQSPSYLKVNNIQYSYSYYEDKENIDFIAPQTFFIVSNGRDILNNYTIYYGDKKRYTKEKMPLLLSGKKISKRKYKRKYKSDFNRYYSLSSIYLKNYKDSLNIASKKNRTTDDSLYRYRAPSSGYSGGRVNVKGYYRKDGTYVRPHTRSAPRKR